MPSALIQPCFEQALIWFKEQEYHVKTIKIPYVKMKNYWKKSMMKLGCMIRNSVNGASKAIRLTPEIWSVRGHLHPP